MNARTRLARLLTAAAVLPLLIVAACGSTDATTPSTTSSVSATSTTSVSSASSATAATSATPPPSTTSEAPPPPPPPPATNPLTGGPVSTNVVVAAKIDNTNFGGLQYGTSQADVVYVEMVEGGLTRLLVVFHSEMPEEIGPVRSVRTTDPDVLTAYGSPGLIFSGGAGGPLDNLAASSVVPASPDVIGDAYWRSSVATGTHNLHANVAQVATSVIGISGPKSPGFTFGVDYPALPTQREVGSLTVSMLSPIRFSWTGSNYHYIRQGEVSVDGNGPTLEIQNVLVQSVIANPDGVVDAAGNPSYKTETIGSGNFTLYRDGRAVNGNWSRPDATSPTSYLDASGNPVLFRPGKTWVLLAPQSATISEG